MFLEGAVRCYLGLKTKPQLGSFLSEKRPRLAMLPKRTMFSEHPHKRSVLFSLISMYSVFAGENGLYLELKLPMSWGVLNRDAAKLPTSRPVNVCSVCWGVCNHSDLKRPGRGN